MNDSQAPINLESGKPSNRKKNASRVTSLLISVLLGGISAGVIFLILKQTLLSDAPQSEIQTRVSVESDDSNSDFNTSEITSRENTSGKSTASREPLHETSSDETPLEDNSIPLSAPRNLIVADSEENASPGESDSLPEFPEPTAIVKDEPESELSKPDVATKTNSGTVQNSSEQDTEKERKEPKLSKRRWTTLLLLNPQIKGDSALPDDVPIWNIDKGYSFEGSMLDQHRLGGFRTDGEFIIRDGFLRREFGNTALLRLPAAEDFELEGLIHLEGAGGWLVLLGWDIEKKSGYVIYNTKLRVSGSMWFAIEIADGKPVPNSERLLVKRDAQGEGALRLLVEKKKVSMQAADAYLFRDEELPNYRPGHVAIGTFSPQYGPQNIGIRSLRMKLR